MLVDLLMSFLRQLYVLILELNLFRTRRDQPRLRKECNSRKGLVVDLTRHVTCTVVDLIMYCLRTGNGNLAYSEPLSGGEPPLMFQSNYSVETREKVGNINPTVCKVNRVLSEVYTDDLLPPLIVPEEVRGFPGLTLYLSL